MKMVSRQHKKNDDDDDDCKHRMVSDELLVLSR